MRTDILIAGVTLIAVGCFAAGVASADRIRGWWWALDDKRRARRGEVMVYAPAELEHPRYGPLLATPPGGITVVREDGALSVRPSVLDKTVERVRAAGDPLTGPMPLLNDETYEQVRVQRPASWAKPPPSTEELREMYDQYFGRHSRQIERDCGARAPAPPFPCCEHCDVSPCETPGRHHVACIDCQPAFGADRCEADVLAAEDGAPVMLP